MATETEAFKSAETFIRALYRLDDRWSPTPRWWIFRGQTDVTWPLIPSAFRPGQALGDPRAPLGSRATHYEQIVAEWESLRDFVRFADAAALAPAVDDDTIFHRDSWLDKSRSELDRLQVISVKEWPFRNLVANLALAQHHGVPTRLIDWSESPLAAAYFAAADAAQLATEGKPSGDLCVWAVNAAILERRTPSVEVVYVARARNRRLHAQQGMFTIHRVDAKGGEAFSTVPLDNVVNSLIGAEVVMRCLTLPQSLAPALLRLLSVEGYSAATIYVDHDAVAKTLRELRWRIDRA